MPANVQAEQSILAIMFYDEKNIPKVFERLTSEDFYQESHRIIFEAAVELFGRDTPFDIVLLHWKA